MLEPDELELDEELDEELELLDEVLELEVLAALDELLLEELLLEELLLDELLEEELVAVAQTAPLIAGVSIALPGLVP